MIKMDFRFVLLSCTVASFITTISADETEDDEYSHAFQPEERFLDIFPLTQDNFTQCVLKNNDAWIIIFHDGSLKRTWKSLAVNLRGVVWIGMIDTRNQKELLDEMKYTVNFDPESRVYPHGPASVKRNSWKAVKNPNEARLMAIESLPDNSLRIKGKDLQEFLVDCYMCKPSKFPVILITDETETPALFKALSYRFKKYFNFGRICRPTLDDFRALGMEDDFFDTPQLFVLLADVQSNEYSKSKDMSFSAVQFNTKKMGEMIYPNILRFLFAVNQNYRYTLPGDNQSNDQETAEMLDIIKIEQNRFSIDHPSTRQSPNDNTVKFKTSTMMGGVTRDEL